MDMDMVNDYFKHDDKRMIRLTRQYTVVETSVMGLSQESKRSFTLSNEYSYVCLKPTAVP